MKKFLIILFITLCLSSVLLVPARSHAAPGLVESAQDIWDGIWNHPFSTYNDAVLGIKGALGQVDVNQGDQAAQITKNRQAATNADSCVKDGMFACFKLIFYSIVAAIGNAILQFAAWIMGICGIILDFSLVTFIVQMNANVGKIQAVYTTWQVIRDLANMFFIFILLVIAIKTILGDSNYKKLLRNVILAALFINFSFFFTGLMIDASNITALQFYNGFAGANAASGGVSERVVNAIKIGSIYDPNNTEAITDSTFGDFMIRVILGSILMIVAGGVFLASAVLVAYRFIELVIVLMFSPLAFASLSYPGLAGQVWSPWWKKLKTQLIFAPVYFMFLWVTMNIIFHLGDVVGPGTFDQAVKAKSSLGFILSFVIAIMLLIYSLTLAKQLGASGAEKATNISKGFQGFFARHTAGYAAAGIHEWSGKSRIVNNGITRTLGLDANGRFGSRLRNLTTGALATSGFGTKESYVDYAKTEKTRKTAQAEQIKQSADQSTINNGVKALGVKEATRSDKQKEDVQKLADLAKIAQPQTLKNMKTKDVVTLVEAGMLTPEKVSKILEDETTRNSKERDDIREAFSKKVIEALDDLEGLVDPGDLTPAQVAGLTPPQLAAHNEQKTKFSNARRAVKDMGEAGMSIVDPALTSGRDARSIAFIQMASSKQRQKMIDNTYGEGKGKIRDAAFKSIIDSTNAERSAKLFGDLDGADMAYIVNKAEPGTPYGNALTRILSATNMVDVLEPSKLGKANAEGLNSERTALIKAAVERNLPAGHTPQQADKQRKLKAWMNRNYW